MVIKMSGYKLFIDDERFPPKDGGNWVIARHWEDVMMMLRIHGMPKFISFDHDLGDVKHDGYDIAKFIVDLDISGKQNDDTDFQIPDNFTFYVHSQNPIGKRNIEMYLQNYLNFRDGR